MLLRSVNSFLRHWRYYRLFPHECYGCFRGVYPTFEAAIEAAPSTKETGYDHEIVARDYIETLSADVKDYDYPVMFWLKNILESDSKVFDFGGNIGIHYHQYKKYIDFGKDMEWLVYDLPEILKIGEDYNDSAQLKFTTEMNEANRSSVFLASGSVQYIKDFSELLSSLENAPRHLLINRLPLGEQPRFVTLQNGGKVFYPQYVFNETDFLADLKKIGYQLKDRWVDRIDGCFIPFHSKKSLPNYHGLYLVKE